MTEHDLILVAKYQMAILWNLSAGTVFADSGLVIHGEPIGSDPVEALRRAISKCAEKHDQRMSEAGE
jgi:hypothetical protein